MEDLFFAGFFIGLMAFLLLIIAFGIVVFILQAIGLYKIAKKEGKNNIAWLAWIPVASGFLIPLVVEEDVQPGLRGKLTIVYAVSVVVAIMFAYFLPFTPLIPLGFMLYAFYYIAAKYSDKPAFHLAIGIATIGNSVPFQLFMLRNRERISGEKVIEEA